MNYLQFQSADGKAELPIKFLMKYLDGSATDEIVDLNILIAEDKGVRGAIQKQVKTYVGQLKLFKSTGIDTSTSGRLNHAKNIGQDSSAELYRTKISANTSSELMIDLNQSSYLVADWMNAIGAAKISWEIVNMETGKDSFYVKLSGKNRYRWHPNLPRKSQRVHEAAEAMKKFGAKEYDIVFKPCIMSITTGETFRV